MPPAAANFVRAALTSHAPGASTVPDFVGPFRVLAELGRGGMGRVLLAVRDGLEGAPRVAIKVLDRQVDNAEARRRFDRERETLARLEHPHIARLYDGGVTADGVPYLVMEFVEGLAIDRHCDEHRLDLGARLALMRQVCEAVEFAHGRLVVHRDLKPANVMVDAHGQVKLLDFGIAKWIDDLDADSPLTLTSNRVLTPAYAAPEQYNGDAITAATDVYQLGLLLYTLLTGTRAHALSGTAPDAVRRAVCDTEPTRPSAVQQTGADAAVSRPLARQLVGDLDAIVLKALRKDPRDRYGTVEALGRDLDNYRENRPVSARQGTGIYAVRKYVRRHPVPVAAAAGVLVASLIGMVAVAVAGTRRGGRARPGRGGRGRGRGRERVPRRRTAHGADTGTSSGTRPDGGRRAGQRLAKRRLFAQGHPRRAGPGARDAGPQLPGARAERPGQGACRRGAPARQRGPRE